VSDDKKGLIDDLKNRFEDLRCHQVEQMLSMMSNLSQQVIYSLKDSRIPEMIYFLERMHTPQGGSPS